MTTPPIRLDDVLGDLAAWDNWAAAVDRGEVAPREVAARTRELIGMLRASVIRLVPPTPAPAPARNGDPDLIDVPEVAKMLDCRRPGRVYELKDEKIIPRDCWLKVGARVKFRRSRLQAWIDAGGSSEIQARGGARA